MTYTAVASPDWIRELRTQLGLTQREFADRLGVTHVTVSRWESGLSRPSRIAQNALVSLAGAVSESSDSISGHGNLIRETRTSYQTQTTPIITDFQADPETVRLYVEAERLRYGHLFSPGFGTETAIIDPLPHQLIAVYQHMLDQPRLRFLLADDAGAGKTIMSGLYIREMLNRRLIRRVLIVPPAGLVGNWMREMRTLFSLTFREVTGPDCRDENPFTSPGGDLAIVSVDTLTGDRAFARLSDSETEPYDLVIFDEAHKLSAFRNADFTYEATDRYKLAELLAGAEPLQEPRPPRYLSWHAHHLLLLTATPHMGRDFPYYALWRLLEPDQLGTMEAFSRLPSDARKMHFLRRTKEEMVRFDGSPIYPTRVSDTASYDLTDLEWELYEETTTYVRSHYNRARTLNRSAAQLAMSVLQRRAASSTLALLRSLERRRDRLGDHISRLIAHHLTESGFLAQQRSLRVRNVEEEMTGDEETAQDGREERDVREEEAMSATSATNLAELRSEKLQVESLVQLAQRVYDIGEESKFERLREVIQDPQFAGEKLLVFTEHRDTLEFLIQRLEAMGYAGQVASIHGGMTYPEREVQMDAFRTRCRFMVATDAAGEGINLQFCWIMVNYDIPWNPARIEQRFGRIHRYKQTHDPVVLVNMVAGRTREGRVLKTLLDKLERVRRELGSDKVFDIIGRQFEGASLSQIIMQAVVEGRENEAASHVEGLISRSNIEAVEDQDRRLRVGEGDVASQLPTLAAQRQRDHLHKLLPGYVRRFIEKSSPRLGVSIEGDLDGRFRLDGLPLALSLAMDEATGGRVIPLTVNRPEDAQDLLFLRPGEPFFDRYRAYFCDRYADDALRGAAFIDPYAEEPYLYHLALVATVRRADGEFPEAFGHEKVLDTRLVAVAQTIDGELRQCPVELLMVLRPETQVLPNQLPPHDQVKEGLARARAYIQDVILNPTVQKKRSQIKASVAEREEFLKKGFDYQEAELLEARARLREQALEGDAAAKRTLDGVREKQRSLREKRERALAVLHREPELVEAAEVTFLAHSLVLPSDDTDEKERHDKEIERIAVNVALAHEESHGAVVYDVSTPELARAAGLEDWPGFDLLSHRPDGERRCIEVKGRRSVGDIEVKENEWTKAANLGDEYWLYVVYNCASSRPMLNKVQNPFIKLLVRTRGEVLIDEHEVSRAANTAVQET